VAPNGPEHEQITPIVTGEPDAAGVALPAPVPEDALATALADDELLVVVLLLLFDEHAATDTTIAINAMTAAQMLRRCTMDPSSHRRSATSAEC
jgi:hypothetical protein